MCLNTAGARHIRVLCMKLESSENKMYQNTLRGFGFLTAGLRIQKQSLYIMKARFPQTMRTLKQALFDYNYQNPSLFLFINLLIRAIVILPH